MLKEFDLDAPGHAKPERMRFRSETRCVTALFERCYRASGTSVKGWKILVEVVDGPERESIVDLVGVLVVQVRGDVREFLDLEEAAKLNRALELLMAGVLKLADRKGLDAAPFHDAASEVRRRGFKNEWVWKKPVANKSRSVVAEVVVEHGLNRAEISARFRDAQKNVVRVVPLVSDEPDEFLFVPYLGSFQWLDDYTVELVSRDGRQRFTARSS